MLIALTDLNTTVNHEPRVHDLLLAEQLGFGRPNKIRDLIERNRSELETYGLITPQRGTYRSRPTTEYYLNEPQAMLLCMFSRTPKAAEVRRALIEVFMAWRRGGGNALRPDQVRLTPDQVKQINREAHRLSQQTFRALRGGLRTLAIADLTAGRQPDIKALAEVIDAEAGRISAGLALLSGDRS